MSLNFSMITQPPQWVSAHRACRFTYSPRKYGMVYGDVDGYLTLVVTAGFANTLSVGDRVFLHPTGPDERYRGFHVVKEKMGTIIIKTQTPYAGSSFMYEVSSTLLPEVKLYKGYALNELSLPLYPTGSVDLHSIQPRMQVAVFKPEIGTNGVIDFDISGYLKAVIAEPYKAGYNETESSYQYPQYASTDYLPLNYARVELLIEGTLESTLYVANSALTAAELNRWYVDTGRPLSPVLQPVQFTKGVNYYDIIKDKLQVRKK